MAKKEKTRSIITKLIFVAGFVILSLVTVSIARETHKKNQIQKMIDELDSQARSIEKEKLELADRISYLGSEEYQKKELKDKFNLQEPDEEVVVIKPNPLKEIPEAEEQRQKIRTAEPAVSNPVKWWNYFFKD